MDLSGQIATNTIWNKTDTDNETHVVQYICAIYNSAPHDHLVDCISIASHVIKCAAQLGMHVQRFESETTTVWLEQVAESHTTIFRWTFSSLTCISHKAYMCKWSFAVVEIRAWKNTLRSVVRASYRHPDAHLTCRAPRSYFIVKEP
jgi:hypothetical protein